MPNNSASNEWFSSTEYIIYLSYSWPIRGIVLASIAVSSAFELAVKPHEATWVWL